MVGAVLLTVAAGCSAKGLPRADVAAPTSTTTTSTTTTSTTTTSTTTTSTTTTSNSTSTVASIEPADARAPSIPAWNGHDAAISWTFDDASDSHLDRVVPYLDELGRPGTFYPTCSLVLADAERWRAASERHEIANHTMTHAVAGPDTDPAEITTCHEVLLETIGVESRTFAYTNGVVDEPYLGFSRATYVAARGTWGFPSHVPADQTPDWYALPAYTVFPAEEDPDGTRIDIAVDAIETAIDEGAWLSVVIHAIDEPGYATIGFADLETLMAATEPADVWHVTVADAATHHRVRRDLDGNSPTLAGDGSKTWSWTVIPGMTDVGIKVEPGAGQISQEGVVLQPDAEGFVEIDARVGGFTWIPD